MNREESGSGRKVLVINDGSLSALVASMMERERGDVIAWVPPAGSGLSEDEPGSGRSAELVREQAALLGYVQVRVVDGDPGDPGADEDVGLETTLLLVSAVADAARLGCERVVWPVVCGADLERMQRASERAMLVSRLAWLDEGAFPGALPGAGAIPGGTISGGGFEVTTPLVDLTHGQVEEMACDLDAPEGVCLGETPV
ncbi:MAG: hypothetical protein EA380_11600, partial [Phycisphaeraceae bacterium]